MKKLLLHSLHEASSFYINEFESYSTKVKYPLIYVSSAYSVLHVKKRLLFICFLHNFISNVKIMHEKFLWVLVALE